MEVEVERNKSQKNVQQHHDEHKQQDEKLAESLKKEAEQARTDAERLESEYARVAEERDKTKNELEEMKRMYAALERRMKAGQLILFLCAAQSIEAFERILAYTVKQVSTFTSGQCKTIFLVGSNNLYACNEISFMEQKNCRIYKEKLASIAGQKNFCLKMYELGFTVYSEFL